jgi:hypothetical protein
VVLSTESPVLVASKLRYSTCVLAKVRTTLPPSVPSKVYVAVPLPGLPSIRPTGSSANNQVPWFVFVVSDTSPTNSVASVPILL